MWFSSSELILGAGRFRLSSESLTFSPQLDYGLNEPFLRVFILSYVKLLSDSPLESYGVKPHHVFTRFVRLLVNHDLRDTIKRFAGLSNELLSSEFVTGGDSTHRVFVTGFSDTPVFREYHEWFRTGRPDLLQFLLSFCLFGKKTCLR